MSRNWSKERWRKQYVREPLQRRLWPVMARGLAELLNALAEDDGTLVRDAGEPVEGLVRALGPQPAELELVRAAIELLVREGLLGRDARSIWILDLPRAQARPDVAEPEAEAVAVSAPVRGRTSTERVREHRQRVRSGNAASVSGGVSPPVSSGVSRAVSGVTSAVSPSVSPGVSSSRGNSRQDASETAKREKDRQKDHPPQKRARARKRVSFGVSPSVSPVSSGVTSRVSDDEEEDEGASVSEDSEHVHAQPVQERATLVLASPDLSSALCPERWPEVVAVAEAMAEASGIGRPYLGRYDDDEGVQALVKLYAAGFSQRDLEYVARVVPKQPWWSSGGKRLGLKSLSLEVVRRNLPSPDGRARILSPSVAKVIASVEEGEERSNGTA